MPSRRISPQTDLSPRQFFQQFAPASPPNSPSFYLGILLERLRGYDLLGFPNWT